MAGLKEDTISQLSIYSAQMLPFIKVNLIMSLSGISRYYTKKKGVGDQRDRE